MDIFETSRETVLAMPPREDSSPLKSLPILGQKEERADAQRNRRVLLIVAQRMVEEKGVESLTMDGLAARAGVGVGTVYRRFGDLTGLALSLLDHDERDFQASFISGPPPLGPGAPPKERVRAFCQTFVERLETKANLYAKAEHHSSKGHYLNGAYLTRRAHLTSLLTETGTDISPQYLAGALLSLMGAELYLHQRRDLGLSTDEIKQGLDRLVTIVMDGCRRWEVPEAWDDWPQP